MISALIKPTHKAIQAYYEKLQGYGVHDVTHEMGLRSAFPQLLEATDKPHKWTLIPEQKVKLGGKTVRPGRSATSGTCRSATGSASPPRGNGDDARVPSLDIRRSTSRDPAAHLGQA